MFFFFLTCLQEKPPWEDPTFYKANCSHHLALHGVHENNYRLGLLTLCVYSALTLSLFLSWSIDYIEAILVSYCNPTV